MNMDSITLKFQSVVGKMKSDLSDTISKYEKLDNIISKVSNSMNKIANNTNSVDNSFKKSKQNIEDLERELKSLTEEYDKHATAFSNRPSFASAIQYNPDGNLKNGIIDPDKSIYLTQEKLDEEKARIEELASTIQSLKDTGSQKEVEVIEPSRLDNIKDSLEQIRNRLYETHSSFSDFMQNTNDDVDKLKNNFSRLGDSFKSIGKLFGGFTKNLSKGMDSNLKQLKKLALGLIGVRTAMSMLTKSVNAYLSFDSELQDSLTNSWNMLGSLLAPAIELVVNLFSLATNTIVSFVNALSGIDLVARANAKALETQAKANQKANNAQRGLLGMDEITNLPTESTPSSAPQISRDAIKTEGILNDLLLTLQNKEWHIAGEIIARAIDNSLGKINWSSIQKNFQKLGYNIADFLNGLFELNWTQLGTTLANGLNTAINFAYGFVEKFSFIRFGGGLGRAISNAFTNIDWGMLSTTISDGIIGIFNGISTFLISVDWDTIGESIKYFLVNIKWAEIAQAVLTAMTNAFSGIDALLESVFGKNTANIIEGIAIAIGAVATAIALANAYLAITNILASPITLIVLAIGLAIAGIIALAKNFDEVSNTISTFFDTVVDKVKKIAVAIVNFFISPINGLIDGLNLLLSPLAAIIVLLGQALGKNLTMDDVRIPRIPLASLKTGTNDIETEGLYHLHEGEAVVPKQYNPATGGYDNGADNRQIIDLLVSLNASMLEYADRPIEINMNGRKVAEATYDDIREIDKNRNYSSTVVRS